MPNPLQDIKIPYPTEGVVRTAALDDTVAPADSVQNAVNLNFDRVGAIQTRLGIETYADTLIDPIRNFGTLNNAIAGPGFTTITKLAPTSTFDSDTASYMSAVKVDDTHVLVFWQGTDGDGFAQVMLVDPVVGTITPVGTALEFDVADAAYNACIAVDGNHFLNLWSGPGSDGFAQIFTVNLVTFAVTAEGSALEFNTSFAVYISVSEVDANHFLITYTGPGNVGITEILEINLGTWAVTQPGSPTTFDAVANGYNSLASLDDGTHFINFWQGASGDGFTQVLEVNTGTWAVTALGSPLEFDPADASYNSAVAIGDGEHFINFYRGTAAAGKTQVFAVDLGTFAVVAVGSGITFDTTGFANAAIALGDGEHFANFWEGPSTTGYTQVFEVDPGTFDITQLGFKQSLGTAAGIMYNAPVLISTYRVVNFWMLTTNDGVGATFILRGDIVVGNFLYAQEGNADIENWDGSNWTVRRSGLQNIEKARFAQFLNYIWMVNGNATIGDPVMTSSGGNFGTDLVPAGFPPGDYIQAGFEGRVWVADKLYDVVYFTDIVQFTPPDLYTLTYDADLNFIKNFSPQNGQRITGLFTTPRALLLFKQDTIYRIYGAFSVDAYPAYNVGTYSQESIVQTKNGLYFHHSSGFYQFAYDSQPVEISRRVIDFIQAIPRDYYPEVKGIYNGLDAVEWHVGPLTVEGVYYESCVMRYTISTQVWTIYDYPGNEITALILYDDGSRINMIVGATQT